MVDGDATLAINPLNADTEKAMDELDGPSEIQFLKRDPMTAGMEKGPRFNWQSSSELWHSLCGLIVSAPNAALSTDILDHPVFQWFVLVPDCILHRRAVITMEPLLFQLFGIQVPLQRRLPLPCPKRIPAACRRPLPVVLHHPP